MSQAVPALIQEVSPNPSQRNIAVQRCCAARDRSLEESLTRKIDKYEARKHAQEAYRDALPDLSGYENIRDFIACISHGLLSGDIHPIESTTFLYAAQVAISALRLEPKDKEPKDKKRTAA
ncbi:MAG TPA: hypothetical protein VGG56_13045 [Terracidiphilus sp.]|jgi:hypothetical protein